MRPITKNTLFYGDNLQILREYIPDGCIDLIYLDPPFNSNRSYNVLFKDESGDDSDAQIAAFDDTWHWGQIAEETYLALIREAPENISEMIGALRGFIGSNQMMAYLVMMTARLIELHRVLKKTGSIFLHCDPTASHYLKIIMDTIFGVENFLNEIIWKRASTVKGNAGQGSKMFGPNTDTILFYGKSHQYKFTPIFQPYSEDYLKKFYKYTESDGRRYRLISMIGPGGAAKGNPQYEVMGVTRYWRYSEKRMNEMIEQGLVIQTKPGNVPVRKQYLDEGKGVAIQSLWDDIEALGPSAAERLGYPTQKPQELLERIVSACSDQGDWVLDPFCGCGTAIAAAEKLGRKWIGIDITHLSISLQKYRLRDSYNLLAGEQYDVVGEPVSIQSAHELAKEDRFQFQWWSLSLLQAKPLGASESNKRGKKGKDRGIDGVINFIESANGKPNKVVIQVKSGHVKSGDIRDLRGTVERENAAIGVFVTLEEPSKDMVTEAVSAGYFTSEAWGRDYPRIQILTIEDILGGKQIDMPPQYGTFKQAQRVKKDIGKQDSLFD